MKLVIVGGSAAGPKAASKAHRLDPGAEITIVQKGPISVWPLVDTPTM